MEQNRCRRHNMRFYTFDHVHNNAVMNAKGDRAIDWDKRQSLCLIINCEIIRENLSLENIPNLRIQSQAQADEYQDHIFGNLHRLSHN